VVDLVPVVAHAMLIRDATARYLLLATLAVLVAGYLVLWVRGD
jgi:hypothetical protein